MLSGKWTYHTEVQVVENIFTGADLTEDWSRRCDVGGQVCHVRHIAVGAVEGDTVPLVDGQGFIAVHEPRQVAQPLEVHWHWSVVEEESSEQQQRDDHRRRQGRGDFQRRWQARDEITCPHQINMINISFLYLLNSLLIV